MDANAPVEDEEENTGPVDSDEETAAVMGALASWQPQPVVAPPIHQPIRRTYQLARLHEQLQMATNGGRTNIFRVAGHGSQRLPEGHPALVEEDALGEPDMLFGQPAGGGFGAGGPQRGQSVASRG